MSIHTMDDIIEEIEATPAISDSYTELAKQKILAIDLSHESTYVQLGIGGAAGWMTGVMVGKVGKALATALGGSILLLNMGSRAGYITVDWEKVDDDINNVGDRIKEKIVTEKDSNRTKRFMNQATILIRRNLVAAGGFAAGFFLWMAT